MPVLRAQVALEGRTVVMSYEAPDETSKACTLSVCLLWRSQSKPLRTRTGNRQRHLLTTRFLVQVGKQQAAAREPLAETALHSNLPANDPKMPEAGAAANGGAATSGSGKAALPPPPPPMPPRGALKQGKPCPAT
jgi:hypothetical protein